MKSIVSGVGGDDFRNGKIGDTDTRGGKIGGSDTRGGNSKIGGGDTRGGNSKIGDNDIRGGAIRAGAQQDNLTPDNIDYIYNENKDSNIFENNYFIASITLNVALIIIVHYCIHRNYKFIG